MAIPATSWDETKPAGTDAVSTVDNQIQLMKGQLREIIAVDHIMSSSGSGDTWGMHNKATFAVQTSDPTVVASALILYSKDVSAKAELHFIDEDGNILQLTSKGDWVGGMQYSVIMWSGLTANIPAGWVLCDGNNSTPDLTSRFVRGVASITSRVFTGAGADSVTLTTTELPAHTHTGTTASDGSHTHPLNQCGGGGTGHNGKLPSGSFSDDTKTGEDTATVGSAGSHTHTFTTNSSGTGSAFSILPGYMPLAYIMKS